ncbi:hypothetical protein B0H13DRAFT_2101929 [Mycena leptocephala]|nr:hypothetical protein B0H13DRAFT_2101929 [Mycena leptocephala]
MVRLGDEEQQAGAERGRRGDREGDRRRRCAWHAGNRRRSSSSGRYTEGERRPAGYLLAKRRAADAAEPDCRSRSRSEELQSGDRFRRRAKTPRRAKGGRTTRESRLGDVCIVDAASDHSSRRYPLPRRRAESILAAQTPPISFPLRKPFTISSPQASPRVVSANLSRVAGSETSRLGCKAWTPKGRDGGDIRWRRPLGTRSTEE